ncbi:hypothetical protein SFR_2264 [Streptomyces sp. FR-008]|nr:hypothetical protein SFR_2264 [Streptomyces sp. FR-008]
MPTRYSWDQQPTQRVRPAPPGSPARAFTRKAQPSPGVPPFPAHPSGAAPVPG